MGTVSFDVNFWTITFSLLNFVCAVIVILSNRSKVKADALAALDARLGSRLTTMERDVTNLSARLSMVDARVENAVDDQDLIAVHRRVDEIAGILGPVQGRLDEISTTIKPLSAAMQALGQQVGEVTGMLRALVKGGTL